MTTEHSSRLLTMMMSEGLSKTFVLSHETAGFHHSLNLGREKKYANPTMAAVKTVISIVDICLLWRGDILLHFLPTTQKNKITSIRLKCVEITGRIKILSNPYNNNLGTAPNSRKFDRK